MPDTPAEPDAPPHAGDPFPPDAAGAFDETVLRPTPAATPDSAETIRSARERAESEATVVRTASRSGGEAPAPARSDPESPALAETRDAGGAALPGAALSRAGLPRTVAGRYVLEDEIGRGGMGVVYRARDLRLHRDVAFKILRVGDRADRAEIERFGREARAAAGLRHPGIVQVLDVGDLDGNPFYVMELVPGRELSDWIRDALLGPRDVAEIVRQVAEALRHAHDHGILHRDIKSRNIVVDRAGPHGAWTAKLLDFGLAKFAEQDVLLSADKAGASLRTLTRSGELIGTPAYMSPEQAEGAAATADARTDVYSLGAVMYEALTGLPPFHDAVTLAVLILRICNDDPALPRARVPDLDRDLETVCLKCLRKEPRDRYATAGDLADDCRRWLAGEPVSARPLGRAGRLWRKARRHRAVALALFGLSALLLAVAVGGTARTVARALEASSAAAEAEALLAPGEAASVADLERAEGRAVRVAELEPESPEASRRVGRARAWRRHADGRAAVERFRAQLAEADAATRQAEAARKTRNRARQHADQQALWEREREARDQECRAQTSFARAVASFTEALGHWPGHPHARAALAGLYWDRYRDAERRRATVEQETYAALVRELLPDVYVPLLAGVREVRVEFLLPAGVDGARVRAHLYGYRAAAAPYPPVIAPVPCDPRTGQPLSTAELGPAEPIPLRVALAGAGGEGVREVAAARDDTAFPLRALEGNGVRWSVDAGRVRFRANLPKGSYLLHVPSGQGVAETRYPFEVARDRDWDETCALPPEDEVPPMPPGMKGDPRRYWVFVPAGPFRASGDPRAVQSPPRDEAEIRLPEAGPIGFRLARFEATTAMYLAYLNDRAWHPAERAFRRVPRTSPRATSDGAYFDLDETGSYRISLAVASIGWTEEWPICGISWEDAVDYCAWLTKACGGDAWRFELPSEDEWEKAARGPDGRFFPWGDEFDSTFCNMQVSREGEQQGQRLPEPWGLFPLDESPYGVRDLAGGLREWSRTEGKEQMEYCIAKGGSLGGPEASCRAAGRDGIGPRLVSDGLGFRVRAVRARE